MKITNSLLQFTENYIQWCVYLKDNFKYNEYPDNFIASRVERFFDKLHVTKKSAIFQVNSPITSKNYLKLV